MRIIRLAALAAFVAAFTVVVNVQVRYPALRGRVNDYANMLSSQEERVLDQKLAAYEAKTSIQMVIVVAQTLNNESPSDYATNIGTHWGIGQRGRDNGIVILWYPRERDYFVATGYGLEAELTDGAAGEIARRTLAPYFKQEQWAQGLNQAVDAIISHLGEMSWEERESGRRVSEESKRQQAVEAERVRAEQFRIEQQQEAIRAVQRRENMKMLVIVVLSGVVVLAIVLLVISWNRKRKLKNVLRPILESKKGEVAELQASLIADLTYTTDRLALQSDKDEAVRVHGLIYTAASNANSVLTKLTEVVERDPDTVEKELKIYDFTKTIALRDSMKKLAEDYSQALVDAPAAIAAGKELIASTEAALRVVEGSGYKTGREVVVDHANVRLKNAQEAFSSHPADPVTAMRQVQLASEELNDERTRCEGLAKLRADNEQSLVTLTEQLASLRLQLEDSTFKGNIAALRSLCPEAVWKGAILKVETAPQPLGEAEATISTARRLNSMEVQNFQRASVEIESVTDILNEIDHDLVAAGYLYDDQLNAKNSAKEVVEQAKVTAQVSPDIFTDSDVEEETRAKYRTASANVKRWADEYAKGQSMDWVALNKNIAASALAVHDAAIKAQDEIRAAKKRRQAAVIAASQPRARSSSYRSSSTGSGGFRGGGGRFGGGGAGGKY